MRCVTPSLRGLLNLRALTLLELGEAGNKYSEAGGRSARFPSENVFFVIVYAFHQQLALVDNNIACLVPSTVQRESLVRATLSH